MPTASSATGRRRTEPHPWPYRIIAHERHRLLERAESLDMQNAAMTSMASVSRLGARRGGFFARAALLLLLASCSGDTPTVVKPPDKPIAGPPASLVATAGHGQTVVAGERAAIPLTVLVKDAAGVPVPGVEVKFARVDGSLLPIATVTTDVEGVAALVDWMPPTAAGLHTVQARTLDLIASFGERTIPGPVDSLIAVGTLPRYQSSAEADARVIAVDRFFNFVQGALVTFRPGTTGGTISDSVQTTSEFGVAAVTHWRLGSALGTYSLAATTGSIQATLNAAVVSGPPASIARIQGDSQRVVVGAAIFAVALVADAEGRPVPGAIVSWRAEVGGVPVFSSCGPYPTDGLGKTSCQLRTTRAGLNALVASTGNLTTTFMETALAVPSSFTFVSAPDTTAEFRAGSFLAAEIRVSVRLADGSAGIGYPVSFGTSWDGSVSRPNSFTDSTGIASTRWQVGLNPGRATLASLLNDVLQVGTSVRTYGPLLFLELSLGASHSCGIAFPAIYCWGSNGAGQIGDGKGEVIRLVPSKVGNADVQTTQIVSLEDHSCSITTTSYGRGGTVTVTSCWGGAPDSTQVFPTPRVVSNTAYQRPGLDAALLNLPISRRSDGASHACVLTSTGSPNAYCVGRNDAGQLGDGTTETRTAAVAVVGGLYFGSLVVGANHSCAIDEAGRAYCWGKNDAGQLGDGSSVVSRTAPVAVSGGLTFQLLAAGAAHTCGLLATGEVYCWGANTYGQLGTGSGNTSSATPVRVAGGLRFSQLAAGGTHTCAMVAQKVGALGPAYCWGRNNAGQLGDGTTIDRGSPTPVADYHP
jgi:hypothetical protein